MAVERRGKLIIGLIVACLILIIKLFVIQIVDDKYKINSSNNSMVYEIIYPTRGVIYDRNGEILVGNKMAYDIMVTPREVTPFDTLLLAKTLGTTPEFIRSKMAEYKRDRKKIGFQSVVMMKQVDADTYTSFAEISYLFPGIKGQTRSIRYYPVNAGGNLLGYVSEVDGDYIKKHPDEYRPGDYAGKTGIEASRENDLRGEKGYSIYLRNSKNQIQSRYNDGSLDKEAVPGKDLVTTIDATLQQYGQNLMKNKVGSLVAIEPETGEILALVSSPGIDVEQLGEIRKYYSKIAADPYKPMFNRAVQAYYPPGSVFKLVNGLICLQEGTLKETDVYPCYRGYTYATDRKLGCHNHASPLSLQNAIMNSCNAYFCYALRAMLENRKYSSIGEALEKWNEYVNSFGFGHKLGSDFPYELSGTIPSSKTYNKYYGKGRWRFATIVSISIGQGEIGATPLQIANLSAIIANRGWYKIPHLIKDSPNLTIDPKYKEKVYTMVDTTQFQKVIPGMWKAVNAGWGSGATASIASVPGLDICGKTGTAQNPHGADNSVFICFAPMDNPKIAVAAYVENAGFGSSWAAPIASLLVEKYLNGEISRPELEDHVLEGNLMSKVKVK